MPHIDIKCYPKHLTCREKEALRDELVTVALRHLKARDSDVSIRYTEVPEELWKSQVWDTEIAPHINDLLKRPGYTMSSSNP